MTAWAGMGLPGPERENGMIVTYTAEELWHIKEIKETYAPEREQLQRDIEAARRTDAGQDTLKALALRQQALHESLEEKLGAYLDQIQRERFAQIGTSPKAIIANAKEQAPQILEILYQNAQADSDILAPKAVEELKIGTIRNGKLYMNANTALEMLKSELRHHINALLNNQSALRELMEVIVAAVESSSLTDNEEISEQAAAPARITRFRRSPLAEITTYGLMNDKANTRLIQDDGIFQTLPDGQIQLRWNVNQAPGKKEQVPVYIALTYDVPGLSKKLSAFDIAVYNAVSDLFYYWKRDNPEKPLYVTPQEIWRRMNGKQSKDGNAKPSQAKQKQIARSMNKLRHIDFYMDITEELKAHYVTIEDERLVGGYLKDYLINCSEVVFYTEQGRAVTGYRINYEPILYTYNAAKGHIIFLPFELLDTSSTINDGENVTEFKQYLLRQIAWMKNAAEDPQKGKRPVAKRSTTILIETIYTATGIKTPEERAAAASFTSEQARQTYVRKTRKADAAKVCGILDAWKAKGWINGYELLNEKNEPVRERQRLCGVRILL